MEKVSLGQTALEYLMNYGWALVVIVIVISFLSSYLDFPSPHKCGGFDKFLYLEHAIGQDGNFFLQLKNTSGGKIKVQSVSVGADFNGSVYAVKPEISSFENLLVKGNVGTTQFTDYMGTITINSVSASGIERTTTGKCYGVRGEGEYKE